MSHSRYFNRELSWLQFNRRVLEEASNRSHPLLERLRFLSISGSNLDEFFMVRVAGLRGQQIRKIEELSVDGMTASEQLEAVTIEADALMADQQKLWQQLRKHLAKEGIAVIDPSEIGKKAEAAVEQHFREQILPVLTPQVLDPGHPFPFIPNLGLSVIFEMRRLHDKELVRQLIMIPSALPRFIRVPGSRRRFVPIEELIKSYVGLLFPDHKLLAAGAFRILRDSDIEVEEEAEDLVRYFRSAIKRRRRGRVIRLKMQRGLPSRIQKLIRHALGGEESIVTETIGFLGIGDLAQLVEEDRKALKFKPYTPRFPERILEQDGDCFAAIRQKDIVVHHPYESFDVVLAFLQQAAADPDVLAIKQTLYRAGKQSAVIRALCDAAEAGKSVTAVVELKARFDEEQNLMWASQLENSGVQVIYGFVDMKTHAKISMVVRRENGGIKTYCHFGTGNYHPITARIYTDLSFFTADPRLGRDAGQIFNFVTGYVEPHNLEMLSMSPLGMREKIMELIDAEIAFARNGQPASLWAKLNSLVDPQIIEKLYEASEAGVEIDLVVRGICCLRPGVKGMSSRIRVKSIVGRFLEHSRIWAFGNGQEMPNPGARVYISSADWMSRNFDRRVEYMLPIENPTVHDQILDQVMVANLIDNEQSWKLTPSGEYVRLKPEGRRFNLHQYFMTNPSLSGRGGALAQRNDVPKLDLVRQ
ncbi:MAG TPA: RNA degradosome polyphosphate kinase [Sphingorhabdus sp.]|uniref:RNA degradosome polyphosphate kinase n=1 Tax=Sphingorhabdus sp. TaxID=1902408 RepID=UPI002C4BFB84|nr:RNA degradosome polyphosphate kinase [Sphingorhabdus sp.]HMT40028.1 RNA degradosome polyphosphate kinase [Sphingorhabdus sp.]HMU22274.1 RNA degradosome polyphosphate kinase [Sphingorhabdus sp.]